MFDSFDTAAEGPSQKRWLASAGTSISIYVVIGVIVAGFARSKVVQEVAAAAVDVTFHTPEPVMEQVPDPVEPPPAALPEPKPVVKKPGPPVAAKPGSAKPQSTPKSVPTGKPDEGAPGGETAEVDPDAFGEEGSGGAPDPTPVKPAEPAPALVVVPKGPPPKDVVDLPDDGVPAQPVSANAMPEYPEAERRKGIESIVILRLVVTETGEVEEVTVVRGEEPFVSVAIAAVKTWHYEPATVAGHPVATARLVKIPFRIKS